MDINEAFASFGFDLTKILEGERVLRRDLAALCVAEKLRLLDALHERELAIRGRAIQPRSSALRGNAAPPRAKPQ
jgi:hypothetical protein